MAHPNTHVLANVAVFVVTTVVFCLAFWRWVPWSTWLRSLATAAFLVVNLYATHRLYPKIVGRLVEKMFPDKDG